MAHWIKEAFEAAMTIRKVRKGGETAKLALVCEDELIDSRSWLAKRDYENQLMQQCIYRMIEGRSPCWHCEEEKTCTRKEHMNRGCTDWWLRFLTKEEERKCEQRAAKGFRQEDSIPSPGDDKGTKDECTVQERDHDRGPDQGV